MNHTNRRSEGEEEEEEEEVISWPPVWRGDEREPTAVRAARLDDDNDD